MSDLIGQTLGQYRIVEDLRRLPLAHPPITDFDHPRKRAVNFVAVTNIGPAGETLDDAWHPVRPRFGRL